MAVNIEPGRNGTIDMMTSRNSRELLEMTARKTVVCSECHWRGKGAQLIWVDTYRDENDPNVRKAEMKCPVCNVKVLDFEVVALDPREAESIAQAEALLTSMKGELNENADTGEG